MNTFSLQLQDAIHAELFEDVNCFVGEDISGSFSILAHHARFITTLTVGLARFRRNGDEWTYIALPGGVLYLDDKLLTLSTRHYLLDNDYLRISAALQQQILQEEEALHTMKQSLRSLEDEFLKRMWQMGRSSGGQML